MKKILYLSFLLSFCLHFVNAQDKQLTFETSFGGGAFLSGYDVPKELAPASTIAALSGDVFIAQLIVIPVKKKIFFLTGIGLNGYLSGIKNKNPVLKILEYIPSSNYIPTKVDSTSIMVGATSRKLYIAIPLSLRYVFSPDASISVYVELGMENEFLISSNTSISSYVEIPGIFSILGPLSSTRRENGPIVDFYASQINKYAANAFGTLGLNIKMSDKITLGFTMSYQRSLVERNKLLTGTHGINNSTRFQYAFTR